MFPYKRGISSSGFKRRFSSSLPKSPSTNRLAQAAVIATLTGISIATYKHLTKTPTNTPPEAEISLFKLPPVDTLIAAEKVEEIFTKNQISKYSSTHSEICIFIGCVHLANSVASNNPIEDYHSEHESKDGLVVGIYDGHSGPQCAATVSKVLSSYVQRELNIISSGSDGLKPKDKVIDGIKDAFVKLDHDITLGSLLLDSPSTSNSWLSWNPFYKRTDYAQVLKGIRTAAAGSCAIIAFLQGDEVYVACTGDCRAVIGRNLGYESQYEALELSKDQTATDPTEFSRLCEEHPGEDATVVVRGRVLGGLMPSRAFGDARYKWPLSVLEVVSPVLGRRIPPNYHTPPYVTAKPEVSYYKRDKSDEFLILACDGLWDFMSSKTAVKVVKEMMDKGYDENYATALIQAGISGYGSGGSILDKERIQHSLSIPAPKCRRFRDDMSVNVLFFPTSNVSIGKMEQSKVVDSVPPFPPTQSPQLYGWIGYLKNLNKPKSPTSTPPLTKSKL